MGHVIGMLDERGEGEWWSEPELINVSLTRIVSLCQIEKSIKRKRNGRLAPLPTEFTSHPHLIRTHALLSHFETIGISPENVALPPSASNTPQHMSSSASGRMTLRDRRKVEEEVTPPPTVSRRGRGVGVGTPRGRGGPSTPIARKAVTSRFVTPPHSHHFEELDTPTAAPSVSKVEPSTSTIPVPPSQTLRAPTDIQAATFVTQQTQTAAPAQAPVPTQQNQPPKIVLRFTRPTPLPPAELASLPSPITPLPPSHSSTYTHLSHLNQSTTVEGSIDQRIQGEGDYLSARPLPEQGDKMETKESPTLPGAFV